MDGGGRAPPCNEPVCSTGCLKQQQSQQPLQQPLHFRDTLKALSVAKPSDSPSDLSDTDWLDMNCYILKTLLSMLIDLDPRCRALFRRSDQLSNLLSVINPLLDSVLALALSWWDRIRDEGVRGPVFELFLDNVEKFDLSGLMPAIELFLQL